MAYGGFEDLPRKTASHKELCDKASNIAKKKRLISTRSFLNDL